MKISDLRPYVRHARSFIASLTGEISFAWRPPLWAHRLWQNIARKPLRSALIFLSVLALVAAALVLHSFWKHRPVPLETNWIVNAPPVPAPGDKFQPQPLAITFDRSIAPLEKIGKQVTAGIHLTPSIPGVWRWWSGNTLAFEPTQDWPAATTFDLVLDRALFPRHARLATLSKQFQTPPFTVSLDDLQFYINPADPAHKQITATLVFSHPIDRKSLEENLELTSQDDDKIFDPSTAQHARRTITYAKRDRIAYIRSADLHLPDNSGYARLRLSRDARTTLGGATLDSTADGQVIVPSLYDLFHFDSAQVVIVQNKEGEPEQALILHGSIGVKIATLASAIHAWVLPPRPGPEKGKFIPWDGPAQITPEILAHATPINLQSVATEKEYDDTQSFHLQAPENAQLYIAVDKGIKALGGFPLGAKYEAVGTIPAYPREIKLMHSGALLARRTQNRTSRTFHRPACPCRTPFHRMRMPPFAPRPLSDRRLLF
jgi:hypothetical protein